MSNFFRRDLNLGRKWGHRLITVIFIAGFLYCLFNLCKSFLFEGGFRPIYEAQDSIASRITSEVKLIGDFTYPGERIDSRPYGVNMFIFWFYGDGKYQGLMSKTYDGAEDFALNRTYCSTQLYNQINEVIKKTNVSKIYIKEVNNYLEPVSMNAAIKYIKTNNVQCILLDSFGENNKFLNPGRVAQDYQNNYYFYKITLSSVLLTIIMILTGIIMAAILLAIPFSLIMLIYYKVIIFIIYGKKKK